MIKHGLSLLLLVVLTTPAWAMKYTLIPDTGLTGGYGFSGTVTTDGSIGSFSDASPIIDWNITILTPGGVDGVTSQVLTPSTSTVSLSLLGVGFLNITPTEISIANSGTTQTTNIFFNPPTNELLSFEGPFDTSLNGFASVSDLGETPGFSFILTGDSVSAPFALIVPEPSVLQCGWIAAGVLAAATRPRRLWPRRRRL